VDAWRISAPGGGSPTASARSGKEEGTAPVSNSGIPDLRREDVIDAFFDLANAITARSLIRKAWTLYRRDGRPPRRP